MRLLPLVPLIVLAACAPHDWRVAVQADTSAAYLAYAAANPTSVKVATARRRAEDRLWNEAVLGGRSSGFAAYLSAFPQGKHIADATTQAYELGWAETTSDGALPAYQTYVSRWPASPHAGEAKVKAEDLTYAQVRQDATEAGYARYLAQYPTGRYADEATKLRDDAVWNAATPLSTRQGYEHYLREFPSGTHADTARLWLRATYVRRVQPVVAIVETWQGRGMVGNVLAQVHKGFDQEFVPDLRAAGFEVLPTRTLDATRGMKPPQEQYGIEPDTGILILEYHEKAGRTFDPSGTATDVQAVLRLYVPNTSNAVWVRSLTATTPDKVTGTDLGALHQAAVDNLMDNLHVYKSDIASQRVKEGT